jgi:hypothetical protein
VNVEQPGKIGKIGYMIAFHGLLFWMISGLDLLYQSLDLWDIVFVILGTSMVIGYIIARKDAFMRQLGWKILFWTSTRKRDRFANLLIALGSTFTALQISIVRKFEAEPEGYWWVLLSGGIALSVIGWTLILTDQREPPPALTQDDNSTST